MENLRYIFEGGGSYFSGLIIAEHINDSSRALMRVDPEYADPDGSDLFWVNTDYIFPEDECFEEEF